MRPLEQGATPMELQATILQSLLSARQQLSAQALNLEPPAKETMPLLLKALVGEAPDAKMTTAGQESSSMRPWWAMHAASGVVLVLSENEKDENPSFIMLRTELVSDLLARALGGKASPNPEPRQPSRIELKFVQQIAPSLAAAIAPLLKKPPKHRCAVPASDKDAAEKLADRPSHVFYYQLQLGGHLHRVSLAIDKDAYAPKSQDQPKKTNSPESSSNVAAEIGRTQINMDVLLKLADQTLERLHALKPGDVLGLTPTSLTEAKVLVRGHEVFAGQIGRSGQNYCFKVSRPARSKTGGLTHMVRTLTGQGEA